MPKVKRVRDYSPERYHDREIATDKPPTLKTARDMIEPACGDPALLTRSPSRKVASSADLAPPVARPAQDANLECPSRFGERLHWRDGRTTDLHGQLLHDEHGHPLTTAAPADYVPLTRSLDI